MDKSVSKISKALLDLAQFADDVLVPTSKGVAALKAASGLTPVERTLLERIDGFRSVEQLLSMSGDLIGVHGALGKLLALGLVNSDGWAALPAPAPAPVAQPAAPRPAPAPVAAKAAPPKAPAPAAPPAAAAAKAPAAAPPAPAPSPSRSPAATAARLQAEELAIAKNLLIFETKHLFGKGASQFEPRIAGCKTIEEIYDLIVKFQQHLAKTGKADPDVFLDRLTKGLASARAKVPPAAQRH